VNTLLLHLDNALYLQPHFVDAARSAGACEVDERRCGTVIRLWSRRESLDLLKTSIARPMAARVAPRLCFLGSGDFHHVSALLIAEAVETFGQPVTVIHVDNHPDWVHFKNGVHCGSWVNEVAKQPLVEKVITLGVCSKDLQWPERRGANLQNLEAGRLELYPYDHPPSRVMCEYGSGACYVQSGKYLNWVTMRKMGTAGFRDYLLERIGTSHVYITIDKDALTLNDAVTNWDQGKLRLSSVLQLLMDVGAKHRIVGADVIGDYSKPLYSGSWRTRMLKKAEVWFDQPMRVPDSAVARNRNAGTNLALLRTFSDIMA
jgi:arginase family enzyme